MLGKSSLEHWSNLTRIPEQKIPFSTYVVLGCAELFYFAHTTVSGCNGFQALAKFLSKLSQNVTEVEKFKIQGSEKSYDLDI